MNERRFLLLIFSIALIIRLIAVFIYSGYLVPTKDALTYDKTAISILQGHGIVDLNGNQTNIIRPLYPIFLSIIYYIFGHSYIAVRVVQSFMYSLISVFLYYIGKNIFGKEEGKLASIISVVFPSFIIFSYYGGPGFILTENLFIFILVGLILYMSKIQRLNYFNCIIIGILTSLLILTRPVGIFLPTIIVVYLLTLPRPYEILMSKLLSIFILFLSIFLTMAPWMIRNHVISQKNLTLQNVGLTSSLTLFTEQFPYLEIKWNISSEDLTDAIHSGGAQAYLSNRWNINEKDVNFEIRNKIIYEMPYIISSYIKKKVLIKNMKIFWSPYYNPIKNSSIKKLNFTYIFLIPFILFGFFLSVFKNNKKAVFLLGIIVCLNILYLFTISCERYRLPTEPLLIIYAAFGFFSLLRIFSRPKQRAVFFSFIAVFFITNVIAYLNSDFTIKWLSNIIP